MRTFIISTALLASTLAVAAPAAAQWAPPVPQGYAYGYNHPNNYGQARRLDARIDQIQRRIVQLDRRNILSDREARRLMIEARDLERRVRRLGYNGLNGRERYDIERRIARLEMRVRHEANDGNRYGNNGYGYNGYNNGYGYNQNYNYDRDRDGRDDRYEDDHGRDHDGRRDRDDD